jgi:serine/threonine-protein kinase
MPDTSPRHVSFGTHRLDTLARELRGADGQLVALTGKAFDTPCCLVAHRDRVVGKDELIATVWPGRVVEENNLTQAISALRRALGDEANAIVTVPGRGYRFVAPLHDDTDAGTPAPARPTASASAPVDAAATPPAGIPAARRWTTPLLALALVLVASIGVVLAWRGRMPAAADAAVVPPAHAAAAAVAAPAPPTTLAVLPFRSLSAGPRDPLLDLGLAETLIARVSGVASLRVRSLSSSQRFAGATADALEAGRALGADYVLEGTTQRRDARVRVNARLLAVRDGRALWSGTFDEDMARAFTLQDGLAEAVTSALALKLRASPAGLRSPCDGTDALAYRAYLMGRYQLDRPRADRMHVALDAFKQAVDRDPSCARAYAGMAFAYRALVMTGDEEPRERVPLARAAAERALAIDPDLAEAHASLGFIQFWYDWDWDAAEASFKRAIALNPSSAQARMAYAHLLANLGRNKEAADQARQAVALDPLSPLILTLSASFLGGGGFPDEAAAALAKSRELEPDFWTAMLNSGTKKIRTGDAAGAVTDLRRALARCGDCSQAASVLGAAYVKAGDRRAAEALLASMEARDRADYIPATSLAALHLALGDREGTLDLLERAYEDRDVRMPFLRMDTRWKPLHDEPRFQALLRKMHFAPLAAPAPRVAAAQGRQRKV